VYEPFVYSNYDCQSKSSLFNEWMLFILAVTLWSLRWGSPGKRVRAYLSQRLRWGARWVRVGRRHRRQKRPVLPAASGTGPATMSWSWNRPGGPWSLPGGCGSTSRNQRRNAICSDVWRKKNAMTHISSIATSLLKIIWENLSSDFGVLTQRREKQQPLNTSCYSKAVLL
jgi:hypothetical protein